MNIPSAWGGRTSAVAKQTQRSQCFRMPYRADIDGLRAIAVLSVVFFHAFPRVFPGGFIGVDIFFVISGFLISSIILESLRRGQFSFLMFYARRILRIFPSLLLTVLATYILGWVFLLPDELQRLSQHVVAGIGFASNFLLWSELGYFDPAAETKPLLHLWSLSVEEQFYLVWPVLLWAAWRQKFGVVVPTLVLALISYFLSVLGGRIDPAATFFAPHTRAWELLCGATLATVWYKNNPPPTPSLDNTQGALPKADTREMDSANPGKWASLISLLGASLLLIGFIFTNQTKPFPGHWALLPALGSTLLIWAGSAAMVNRTVLSNALAVWIGKLSYAIYLWHWPILYFVSVAAQGEASTPLRIAAIGVAFALAWFTQRFLERPLQRSPRVGRNVVALIAVAISTAALGYATYHFDGFLRYRYRPSDVELLKSFLPNVSTRNLSRQFMNLRNTTFSAGSTRKRILIVGDSYAHDFVNAIFESPLKDHVQIKTRSIRSQCGNLFVRQEEFVKEIAHELRVHCTQVRLFDDPVLRRDMQQVDEVWFASSWQPWHLDYMTQSIANVRAMTAAKVRVLGRKDLGGINATAFLKVEPDARYKIISKVPELHIQVNKRMKALLPAEVFVDIQPLLCGASVDACAPFDRDGFLLTFDGTHLTQDGAKTLGMKLHALRIFN